MLESPEVRSVADVVEVETSATRPAVMGEWPEYIAPEVAHAWASAEGIERPYAHQTEALAHIGEGRDVVLATSTASGKSLCYQAPLVDAVVRDPAARALLLFPTKALARDQVEGMRKVGGRLGVGMGTFDGDTPPDQRRATRARAHFVATNPDMLHQSILPGHDRFAGLFSGLKFVVLDELHTYRGVFGSHVANVLRRLWRVCAAYGSRPQIIACSATIANPGALATALTGREQFALVTRDTSPKGPRSFVIVNPKVTDEVTGVRRDYLKVARVVTNELRKTGVGTLAFCRTRKAVELLTRYLREDEALERVGAWTGDAPVEGPADVGAEAEARSHVRGYRGGYLPERRRAVERALRSGEARVVAATNALELGIDIGGVDAVVLAGYPGTRAATWQRAGRSGRRGQPALTIMVLSSRPLDQAVAADTQTLLGRSVEHARVDPSNPEVLVPHLRCAAHELPFEIGAPEEDTDAKVRPSQGWAGFDRPTFEALLAQLGERG
ncbi:MAG: DEAD/DEAH box helicase, partial [Nannocystaceae bacterium]